MIISRHEGLQMNLVKMLGFLFFLSLHFLTDTNSAYSQGLPLGEKMYDMKRSDLKGFEFLRKREWLKKVIDDARNLKQEIASKDAKEGQDGRAPAGIFDIKSQQKWEKEIDLLLRDEEE